jgi:hypothetical protein
VQLGFKFTRRNKAAMSEAAQQLRELQVGIAQLHDQVSQC